ncbi:triacylglycerol lipase [Streptomyces sp. CC228A]|uniref:esterase/lipase family protein n=1 Tax=Streptomyces sp. CC228A TaxID=2898186 RepID=UPI001F3ED2A6|nr:alpha/beta fold hydrolase [Streptomyces sp. CC228A]
MAKATALEVAVLALHLLLYPTGVTQERRLPYRDGGAGGPVDHGDGGAQDRRPREHEPRSRRASDSEPPDGGAQHEGPRTCEAAVDQDLRERGAHEPHAGEPEAPAHKPQPSRDRPAHQCGDPQARVATAHSGGPGGRQAREPRVPQWAPPPVVLLHGLVDNRSVFVLLRRALGRGRHVEALNYSLLTCDLRTAARQLARHVEDVCARTGHRQVDLVGHSLGGLVARYYVQRLGGDERVRTVVTLGTPHSGTAAVPLAGLHPLVRQMRPGSPVLRELAGPAPGCRTRFVSFWSGLDHWMAPAETARLHHPDLTATNVEVIGIGHLALPVHPAVSARVREELDARPCTATSGGSASVSVA